MADLDKILGVQGLGYTTRQACTSKPSGMHIETQVCIENSDLQAHGQC